MRNESLYPGEAQKKNIALTRTMTVAKNFYLCLNCVKSFVACNLTNMNDAIKMSLRCKMYFSTEIWQKGEQTL